MAVARLRSGIFESASLNRRLIPKDIYGGLYLAGLILFLKYCFKYTPMGCPPDY